MYEVLQQCVEIMTGFSTWQPTARFGQRLTKCMYNVFSIHVHFVEHCMQLPFRLGFTAWNSLARRHWSALVLPCMFCGYSHGIGNLREKWFCTLWHQSVQTGLPFTGIWQLCHIYIQLSSYVNYFTILFVLFRAHWHGLLCSEHMLIWITDLLVVRRRMAPKLVWADYFATNLSSRYQTKTWYKLSSLGLAIWFILCNR